HPPIDFRHEHIEEELCVLRGGVAYAHRSVANVMGHRVRKSFIHVRGNNPLTNKDGGSRTIWQTKSCFGSPGGSREACKLTGPGQLRLQLMVTTLHIQVS